jgi:hypothetical protein
MLGGDESRVLNIYQNVGICPVRAQHLLIELHS